MSTVERTRSAKVLPPLVAGQCLDQPTFHERYEAMPPETRAELVGGVVYMPSPMRRDHGKQSRFVSGWLFQYESGTPGVEGGDGSTVKMDRKGEPQPDHILLIPPALGGQSRVDEENYLTGAPELIVEIAHSTRHYDLHEKKADYERAGVLEYLVIELAPDGIHWFARRDKKFEDLPAGPDGIYRSEVFPGLWLDPVALFAEDRRRLIRVLREGLASPGHRAFVAKLAEARRRARGRA